VSLRLQVNTYVASGLIAVDAHIEWHGGALAILVPSLHASFAAAPRRDLDAVQHMGPSGWYTAELPVQRPSDEHQSAHGVGDAEELVPRPHLQLLRFVLPKCGLHVATLPTSFFESNFDSWDAHEGSDAAPRAHRRRPPRRQAQQEPEADARQAALSWELERALRDAGAVY
jgi:hypothetical protein